MASQLPTEAVGLVTGVLIISFLCLFCGLFLLYLVWIHHELTSYVGFLAFFTSLSTTASITQQIHTAVWWNDIVRDSFAQQQANSRKPEIAIIGTSTGLDLVLFRIQFYTYNVESILTLFWAAELALSVFQIRGLKNVDKRVQMGLKVGAVLLPIVQIIVLQLDALESNVIVFLFLANIIMVFSIIIGIILLLLVLAKYLLSKRQFGAFHVEYGNRSRGLSTGSRSAKSVSTEVIEHQIRKAGSIYDRWLILRFTVAFVFLAIFECATIGFEVSSLSQYSRQVNSSNAQPDFSAAAAASSFIAFIPGVTPSAVSFVVFGTTKTFRSYMWKTFVPRNVRARSAQRKRARAVPSMVVPRHAGQTDVSCYRGFDVPPSPGRGDIALRPWIRSALPGPRDKAADEMPILMTTTVTVESVPVTRPEPSRLADARDARDADRFRRGFG